MAAPKKLLKWTLAIATVVESAVCLDGAFTLTFGQATPVAWFFLQAGFVGGAMGVGTMIACCPVLDNDQQ